MVLGSGRFSDLIGHGQGALAGKYRRRLRTLKAPCDLNATRAVQRQIRESALLWYNIHAYLLSPLITLLIWLMIIAAVLSWLVAFNVVNPRNQFVGTIMRFSDAITRPLLRPLQRFIPPLGGIDITPIILILLLQFFDAYVLGKLIIPALASITPF
jgi:YggT family protein